MSGPGSEYRPGGEWAGWRGESRLLAPDAAPNWLRPLVDNADDLRNVYRRRMAPEVMKLLKDAKRVAPRKRDAAVLVLFSGPPDAPAERTPPEADLLVTVRSATLRHHAGQAAFPGGAADPGDPDPVHTALREAREETDLDVTRLRPLTTLSKIFIPPSGFHVVPVLAYSPDPGPVRVVDPSETAHVTRVPLRAFINPENRIMVYRKENTRRSAGPAFLLNEMLVWGFTGQVISAMLDVAGWAQPWDTDDIRELEEAMALVGRGGDYREAQL
ncbi:NUDIX domain protein [Mycolicibacterium hassiacum DSM 44199]|uniref:NUDIX domain protein n=1 Tax=Mycolicibacterium hassiacum (strain DSM 44199 / CIP 105218 / JCM 12690 / 3849) TaxID=1122247 RepID=K5BD55_MYCHD|nr:CoA pyrophosphatase [Mycolicibacterium hassiacum]EKF22012.1 NUDIX domain protein [Mycolicibacterium hassiacum DSM 44199]MDA4086890.1 NTP pyrophosphohydrolase [Mycolicibacterium hassiacum DSM 44199]PZN24755.1 MAG: CoA pyrophosphatase [Mycolicibacterium hassiacum]VCT92144.1 putative Nudix hydrolase NudL [Mycolicibacterium hassiacum DSM 44199]